MTVNQFIVTKSLAGVEDLLLGTGTEVQTRAGEDVTITRLTLLAIVTSIAELVLVNTDEFLFAALFDDGVSFYSWDGVAWVSANTATETVTLIATPTEPLKDNGSYALNTSGGSFDVSPPPNPTTKSTLDFLDHSSTWGTSSAFLKFTGQKIMGLEQDYEFNVDRGPSQFSWVDSGRGWILR